MAFKKRFVQLDGTPKTYTTARQGETYLYITGSGDDLVNNVIGAGPSLKIKGASTGNNSLIIGFLDDIYLKDGILFWTNAVEGDSISVEIVLPADTLFPSKTHQGNYDLVDGVPVENSTWTGEYIMFPYDVSINRFINKFEVEGTNNLGLTIESSDTALIPKQLRVKLIVDSASSNPDIVVRFATEIYRERTI